MIWCSKYYPTGAIRVRKPSLQGSLISADPATTFVELFLWSDDTEDASGATVKSSEGVLESIIQDYPNSHMVLMHSVIETSKFPMGSTCQT